MNRRSFLSFLGAGALVSADPELIAWKPKLISIPKPFAPRQFTINLKGIEDLYLVPALAALANRIDEMGVRNYRFLELPQPLGIDVQNLQFPKIKNVRHLSAYDVCADRFFHRLDVCVAPA